MKILSPRVHGYLDFLVVAVFLLAPALFGLTGAPATISYALAAIHLVLTLLTAFPFGIVKVIPFTVHGALELVTAIALVALPWLLGFSAELPARNFYVGAGFVIFVVWLITDYRGLGAATG